MMNKNDSIDTKDALLRADKGDFMLIADNLSSLTVNNYPEPGDGIYLSKVLML